MGDKVGAMLLLLVPLVSTLNLHDQLDALQNQN